jgi:hypothetical protein
MARKKRKTGYSSSPTGTPTWADSTWSPHDLSDKAPAEAQINARLRDRRTVIAIPEDPFRRPVTASEAVCDRIVAAATSFPAVDIVVPVSMTWLARALADCRGERHPKEAAEARLSVARSEWGYAGDAIPKTLKNLWFAAATGQAHRIGPLVEVLIETESCGAKCLILTNLSKPLELSELCDLYCLDWVITTCSGSGSASVDAIESVIDECAHAQIPVWVDRVGPCPTYGGVQFAVRDDRGACIDDWPESIQMRERP